MRVRQAAAFEGRAQVEAAPDGRRAPDARGSGAPDARGGRGPRGLIHPPHSGYVPTAGSGRWSAPRPSVPACEPRRSTPSVPRSRGRRARDVTVDVLVTGQWLHGHVTAVDGHGLVLHGDDDVLSVLRMDSITAVQVRQAAAFEQLPEWQHLAGRGRLTRCPPPAELVERPPTGRVPERRPGWRTSAGTGPVRERRELGRRRTPVGPGDRPRGVVPSPRGMPRPHRGTASSPRPRCRDAGPAHDVALAPHGQRERRGARAGARPAVA